MPPPQWGGGHPLPNKNIPGRDNLFAPSVLAEQQKKIHQECTTNRHFEIQNQKKISGRGLCPLPSGEGDTLSPHPTALGDFGASIATQNIFGLMPLRQDTRRKRPHLALSQVEVLLSTWATTANLELII